MLSTTLEVGKHSTVLTDQICRRFSLNEITSATNHFDEALVVGRGGFGEVYKGQIDGSANFVAIKRSNSMSNQGAPEFLAEVEMLSKLRHCNLVSLIGYCAEEREMVLVYDYMPHGTLGDHLHRPDATLSWLQRLKVCIGAARGLDYLHTGAGTQHGIIHRDVKTSNVLLDENFAAKVADFGLAKVSPTNPERTGVSTMVKGTFGYMDPCYVYTGKLTRKSDVYSFGVVLLEVICGRPAVDTTIDDEAQWGLAPWAQEKIKQGKLSHIVDYRLRGQISSKCLKDFSQIASRCLHNQPDQRPTMADIVSKLQVILSLQERHDASVSEGKFMDRVILYFSTKVESKQSNEGETSIKAGDIEGEPSNKAGGDTSDRKQAIPSSPMNLSEGTLRSFSYNVLKLATRNFRPDYVLGEGPHGLVFKGWIDEQSLEAAKPGTGSVIVVKRINNEYHIGQAEWLAEINYLGMLNHPNLVKLIGYCLDDKRRFLIYEFMAKGSLENHLFRRSTEPLSWEKRIQIVLDAAKGLAYLHRNAPEVIFCGLTTDSILLDSNYNSKLSNFGLTETADDESVFLSPPPSPPYILRTERFTAPECIKRGVLTARSHIYSLGVLLLEVLTGMRRFDCNRPYAEMNLLDYAKPYLTNGRRIQRIIDTRMDGMYSLKKARRAAQLTMKCLLENPSDRPTADEVVKELEELQTFRGLQKVKEENIKQLDKRRA